jgi:3-oxoacyl-[acyl-carrier-protein] synthase II
VPTSVFVTGLGLVTPVGLDTESTWQALLRGASGIDYIKTFDTDGFKTTFAGEITDFDPADFMERKVALRLDRFAQFAVAATRQALDNASLVIDDGSVDPTRVGVVIGSGMGGIITTSAQSRLLEERGPAKVSPFLMPMMLPDMAAGQVSILFGARGPNYCIVTACSSGADAIGIAAEMIRRGEVDIAIAGGAEAPVCPIGIAGFNSCFALSTRNHDPKGASRPFDAERDGFVLAEGAGVLVLESGASMERRGVRPLANLAGYGASSDAHHITQPKPTGEGAALAMKKAMDQANITPKDLSYINSHGTGTLLNDKYETLAIKRVMGNEAQKVKISATKSMTGHLLGAAGGVEAACTVLAVNRGESPPTINLSTPDPDCDLDYTPYTPYRGVVSAAMSNNFGFGGHNASLVFTRVTS